MRIVKRAALALAATAALTTAAQAGGFSRGTADTDILFEDGAVVGRTGLTVVIPGRDYTATIFGGAPAASEGFENPAYVIPSVAVKVGMGDIASCAGTYTTPFGGNSDFSNFTVNGVRVGFNPTSTVATQSTVFVTNEFGLTCQAGAQVGRGRAFAMLGGFLQTLDYDQRVLGGARDLLLNDTSHGYRIGAGYEIPEIALRAQVIYRSEVDVDATGSFVSTGITNPFVGPDPFGPGTFDATGTGTLPRSLEVKLQSGIAAGTLAFLNVKWTDWSVFDQLTYDTGVGLGDQTLDFFYRDGWTVSAGVGRQVTETIAASLAIGYDRGVGTGYDISTDTWSLAAGVSLQPNERTEFRFGGALLYLTEGEETRRQINGVEIVSPVPFLKADDDIGLALSSSLKFRF